MNPPATATKAARPARDRALWFGLLGGAAAWFAQHVVGYAMVEIKCHSEVLNRQILGLEAAGFLGVLVTVLAAAVAAAAALTAIRNGSGDPLVPKQEEPGAPEPRGRVWFMSYVGVLLSALFLIAILAGGSSMFFLMPC